MIWCTEIQMVKNMFKNSSWISYLKESLNIISSEANHGNVFKRTKTKNITCKTNHFLFFNQNNLNSIMKQITIVVKEIQFHDWFNQFLKHLLFPHQQSQLECGQRRAVEKINEKVINVFIGPESDHWLCLSLTHSLTHSVAFSKLGSCDHGVWSCLLVEVVTVADVSD